MFAYFVYFMTRNIIKEDREQKRDQLFYNDIYEIVQKEMVKRNN